MGAQLCSPVLANSSLHSRQRQSKQFASSNAYLEPFNHANSCLPPVWAQMASFQSLPTAEHFHRNLPSDPASGLLWSVDLHFVPRSERQLIVSFAAHLPRGGMTPVPVNQFLSGGCISVWRINSGTEITCSLLPRLQSMSYPCRVAVHPSRPKVCFAGELGLSLVDLLAPPVNGLPRVRSAGKPNMGEVIKSLAMSPNGTRILVMLRLAHRFYLRIVRLNSLSDVENEVSLGRLIPSMQLGRDYTETGHCAWSWDGRRVGFTASTGHYGVLLLRRRRDSNPCLLRKRNANGKLEPISSFVLPLEWCRSPADAAAASSSSTFNAELSSTRAFAFWPVNPESAEFVDGSDSDGGGDDVSCRCLLALGDSAGHLHVVGGFVDVGNDDKSDFDVNERLAAYLPVQRVGLSPGETAEVLQFSSSGRLLAVGCRTSGRIRVYRFDCRRVRRREGESDDIAARAGITVSLQLLRILEAKPWSPAALTVPVFDPVVSLAFADTEEVLASADTAGFVRLWRLPPPSQLECTDDNDFQTVRSLAELSGRAVASRCPIDCADRLPLPPSLLPPLCPNLLDRLRTYRRLKIFGNNRDSDWNLEFDRGPDEPKVFSVSLF
ncbi:hypothetical protein BOX15_Mlig016286g2 [Macrostomum lignano]|uniref:Uncharacterized protein n=1 Tax=Macrostomum lignano TaxID=282301 RepID=A0A267GHP7_9PLAT|nr:hypothetical protein BOX15_Mlig016286g2 [Macrostomum lignano]